MTGAVEPSAPGRSHPAAVTTAQHSPTVDIARWRRQERTVAAVVFTALGGCGVVAAAAGLTTSPGSTGERVVVGVIGALLLAAGLGLAAWRVAAPPRTVLDASGDALEARDPRGGWRLMWPDVAALQLVRTATLVHCGWYAGEPRARIWLPRHYLVIRLRPGVERPAGLGGPSPREAAVDLGVPSRTAREVATALGSRLAQPGGAKLLAVARNTAPPKRISRHLAGDPAVEHLDRAASERLHWS